jgi:hypothetical protein
MQSSTNVPEISEISTESPENQSRQNSGAGTFQATRRANILLLTEDQARAFEENVQMIAEYRRNQEIMLEARLRRQQIFLGASQVLHPQSGCLREIMGSTLTRLKNNPLSATVLCFLGITAEVISGVAINCYKFSNNEMNGVNISETNILKNATKTKEDCMEEKLSYAIPAVFFLGTLAVVGIKLYENAQEVIRGRRVISDSNVRETSTAIPPSEFRLDQARHVNADLVLNNSEPNSRNI